MRHYAFLDADNVVTEVIAGIDETELIEGLLPETWYGNFRGQVCKRVIPNGCACAGFTYDTARDAFISPQPYPSWVLDEVTCNWVAPVAMPSEGLWMWDEATLSWVEPAQP